MGAWGRSLSLGATLLADHPWSSSQPWPSHSVSSTGGVPIAPFYTWILAGAWAVQVGTAALVDPTAPVTVAPSGHGAAITRCATRGNATC